MADDGGVLGNLPRSRPGQRSEKRAERTAAQADEREKGAQAAARAGAPRKTASAPSKTASAPSKTAGPSKKPAGARRSAAASPGQPGMDARPEQPASHAGDPVGDAIRTVTGVATTGARVAGGVAREVLRRLPRP
jgi:hypothetical protein